MKPITDKMVEDLVNKTYKPLADKMSKISEDINKEKNHGLITDSITTTVNSLTDKEIQFIDTEALTDILYHLIFENKLSLKEIAQTETIIGIINKSLVTDNEDKMNGEIFISEMTRWLKYHVIPYIYEHKEEYEAEDKQKDEYVSEIKQLDFTIKEDSPLYKRMNIIVRNFYDSFYTHDSLCLYYTYYILKLKGNTDFDLEFRELEDKLYRDFYNYGIFAVIKELRHFLGTFHFTYREPERETIEINSYIKYPNDITQPLSFKPEFKKVVTDISKCVKIDVKDIYKIINIDEIHKNIQSRYNNRNIDNKENLIIRDTEFLYLIEKYFGYYTRPEFILKVAVKAFSITKDNLSTCRWSESYGGEAWGTIARTILHRKTTTSKTIFVDTCWSLQHNTSLFINKVYSQDGSQNDNNLSKVKCYLTEIKDGIFKNVYDCAIKHNTKLDRFVYRTLILENDASVPDAKYHEIEQSHKYTEREFYRKDDRNPYEFDDNYKELIEKFPEKEAINIVQYNDENKIKVYKEIDNSFGLIYAKINKLESGWEDNPNIEILIDSSPFRWITDLNSFDHYMNRNHPLSSETKQIKSEEKTEKADILLIISENVKSLENEEMALIIYKTVWYHKIAEILQNWIYNLKYTTLDIKKNIDLLIGNSLQHGEPTNNPHETLNDDEYELIKLWIEDYLINDLIKSTSLQSGGLDVLFK